MIHYAIVVGEPGAVRREATRLRDAIDTTSFFEGEWVEALAPSRSWAMGAISAPDPTCAERISIDGDVAVLFNGPALHLQGRQGDLAVDVLERFRAAGEADLAHLLGGTYNVVAVSPERGLHAFGDASGLFPLYWGQGRDFGIVSNRSTTVSEILGRGWDLSALAWHVARPNLCGERMPAREARYATPGQQLLTAFGSGEISVERGPTWSWPDPTPDPPRTDLTDDEWDAVTAELVGNFRSLGSLPAEMTLYLTGGKDSRLCLALAKAAGLSDHLPTATWGSPDSPEVEVAAEVARLAGFRHRRMTGFQTKASDEAEDDPPLPVGALWKGLTRHVYRFEGTVSPWDGSGNPMRGTTLNLKGFGGELYRGPGGTSRRLARMRPDRRTPPKLARLLASQHNHPFDPLYLLRAERSDEMGQWLRDWTDRALTEVRADLIGEKFFVDYRLGHWNGPLGQFRPGEINVNPLLGPTAVRKVMELDLSSRDCEFLHFEVMRRAAPELVDLPFLGQVWAPELAEKSGLDLPREPYPTRRSAEGTRWKKPWKWLFLEQQRDLIVALFERAGPSGLDSVCDLDRLVEIVGSEQTVTRNYHAKTVYGCLAITIALLHGEETSVDLPLETAPTVPTATTP